MTRVFLMVSVVASSLVIGSSPAAGGADGPWCSTSPAPCIQSAEVNGVPVDSTNTTWDVYLFREGAGNVRVIVATNAGEYELGVPGSLDDDWEILVRTAGIVPRVVFAYGADVTVSRSLSPNMVTLAGTPVIVTDNDECNPNWPWSCPKRASNQFDGYLDFQITDYRSWRDVAQRESMYGMNYHTNVGMTSIPPEIVFDPATGMERLLIRLANHHKYVDGTVFLGFAHLRIPNKFLKQTYGIDDPSTLTSVGLDPAVSGTGESVVVTQEAGGAAMLVDITDLTFSRRKVFINRGTITPTKPRNLEADRTRRTRGRLSFDEARARGSEIVRHQARCTRRGEVVTSAARRSPIAVTGLTPGKAYYCWVRAISKAGAGGWSTRDRMPARP